MGNFDLVTLGEALVQLNADGTGPLRVNRHYTLHVGGAELNTAIAASRLGLQVGWLGRVSTDDMGAVVLSELRANGVDVAGIVDDPENPTGLFLVQRGYPRQDESTSVYYRDGSAGSHLTVAQVPMDYISRARALHFTGVSLAVSQSLRMTCLKAAEHAVSVGVPVSFDVNLRQKLWSLSAAREHISVALGLSEIVFTSLSDARLLFGVDTAEQTIEMLQSYGARHCAVTCGPDGALFYTAGRLLYAQPNQVAVVDSTGAGDAFAATVLAGLLEEDSPQNVLNRACLVGSLVCSVRGDYAGAPLRSELERIVQGGWVHR